MRLLNIVFLPSCLLFLAAALPAQSVDGSLRGLILDPDQRAISGAEVRLRSQDGALERSARTGDVGAYAFAALRPGVYRLEVTADGSNPSPWSISLWRSERPPDETFPLSSARSRAASK